MNCLVVALVSCTVMFRPFLNCFIADISDFVIHQVFRALIRYRRYERVHFLLYRTSGTQHDLTPRASHPVKRPNIILKCLTVHIPKVHEYIQSRWILLLNYRVYWHLFRSICTNIWTQNTEVRIIWFFEKQYLIWSTSWRKATFSNPFSYINCYFQCFSTKMFGHMLWILQSSNYFQ